MEEKLKSIIKEEINKFLLKEYSSIAPYKENLLKIATELSDYFNSIKQDIAARKNVGDTSVSLHDITLLSIEKHIKELMNDIYKIH